MFVLANGSTPPPASGPVAWLDELEHADGRNLADAGRIELISQLEELKSAAAAAQARVTAEFDASQRELAPTTRDTGAISRSIASQVALARKDSPAKGQRHLGVALALVRDLPHTHGALTRGEISEWRATLIVRETACLSREDRIAVDDELATRTHDGFLSGWGDQKIADTAREIGYRLDPAAAVRRTRKAESERRVSIRPAPDTMSHLSGLLPVADGVAAYASLRKHAETLRAQGDPRTLAQLMADTFLARLTGREATHGADLEIQLVMNERSLVHGSHDPARMPHFGPIPATLARRLARDADKAWIRRLFTHPVTGELVATDSRRRVFTGRLRDLLISRDQTCRTPWCDAPIRHTDHVRSAAHSGPTSTTNGQGLCEACNYTKQAPGWRTDVIHSPGHHVEITTPTGHHYQSHAPPQPGADPPTTPEAHLRRIVDDSAA